MDLSILQKVNELVQQGRNPNEIKQQLLTEGIAPASIDEALKETNTSNESNAVPAASTPLTMHHEKVVQPTPGFDPTPAP